jgi:hypothetical protein
LRFDSYRQWAEEILPGLRAALAGGRAVPPQTTFSEAWLTDALFYYERPLSLEEVIESADAINHGIPNPDEIAWAFLRLRKRGWFVIEGDQYGLTAEGRRAIEVIVTQDKLSWRVGRLQEWFSAHPPPDEE